MIVSAGTGDVLRPRIRIGGRHSVVLLCNLGDCLVSTEFGLRALFLLSLGSLLSLLNCRFHGSENYGPASAAPKQDRCWSIVCGCVGSRSVAV